MSKYEELVAELAPRKFNKKGVIWTVGLVIVSLIGIAAYIDQVIRGQVVTNMRDYVLWGRLYIQFRIFCCYKFCRIPYRCNITIVKKLLAYPFS